MTTPAAIQHGGVLPGVKAKPYGWPTASLDTGCGHHPTAAIRGQQETRSLQTKSPRNQGNLIAAASSLMLTRPIRTRRELTTSRAISKTS